MTNFFYFNAIDWKRDNNLTTQWTCWENLIWVFFAVISNVILSINQKNWFHSQKKNTLCEYNLKKMMFMNGPNLRFFSVWMIRSSSGKNYFSIKYFDNRRNFHIKNFWIILFSSINVLINLFDIWIYSMSEPLLL